VHKTDFLALVNTKLKATEALFTAGEKPELANPGFFTWLHNATGCSTIVEYTKELCKLAITHGLLPHCNLGVLSADELEELRDANAS
jgi:2-iminoacetate synthase ThiH